MSTFLAGARSRTLEAKDDMSADAKALQAPLARLLSGDTRGLASEASEANAEGGEGPAASASNPTQLCHLVLVLRATASPGQARRVSSCGVL